MPVEVYKELLESRAHLLTESQVKYAAEHFDKMQGRITGFYPQF